MSEFKLPHVENLTTNSKLPGQLTEDFKAIEQALSDEVADRKKGDGNLQGQIDKLQERCQKLEDNSATHDDVTAARDFMNDKAERVVLGTDLSTVKRAVEMILKNEGVI